MEGPRTLVMRIILNCDRAIPSIQQAADEISEVYRNWYEWRRIINGEHGCYHEHCGCDKVIAFAQRVGWTTPELPRTPLPSAPGWDPAFNDDK